MTDYKYVASYDVRKVLWDQLKSYNILDEQDYYADGFNNALVPIIPTQQIPEFNNNLPGKTYITYDILQKHTGVQWWMSEESITFGITSTDGNKIQEISNFIMDLFRRYDLSAREVNLKLVSASPYTYHLFHLDSADPVQPFKDEGGFMTGTITISYAYTREVNENGRYI